MAPAIEKISAITFRVSNMKASVQFYRNVLGMELLYGGEQVGFSPLRTNNSESAILNLEQGDVVPRSGRLIFHVTDVDAFWTHLKERGFNPEIPWDASWGIATSTWSIRMATNCRLLGRCNKLGKRNRENAQTKCVWRNGRSGACLSEVVPRSRATRSSRLTSCLPTILKLSVRP
jgi:catechol 2,3-dioxygenase-like lactoylglutathione lyase family enzyme